MDTRNNEMAAMAIGYARVSTYEQANGGVSLEAQQAAIVAYCASRGLTLADISVDAGISGSTTLASRPAGSDLDTAITQRRAGVVIATKMDRLFRSASDCLHTIEAWSRDGTSLHLIDMGGASIDSSSAIGKLFLTIMAGVAEMERNLIRERVTAALAYKIARGDLVGSPKLGYRAVKSGRVKRGKDGRDKPIMVLQADKQEQAAMARARDLHAIGLSLRAIGKILTTEGFSPRGEAWHPQTVRRMCAR